MKPAKPVSSCLRLHATCWYISLILVLEVLHFYIITQTV